MATYENTANRGYQLPHPSNLLADDVTRLRSALTAIDADVHARPTQTSVTAEISSAVNGLVDAAPGTLDTLNELAAALGDDANFASTVTNALAAKAPSESPTFTGTPAAPTAAAGTNTTQLATTAFVQSAVTPKADTASPTFTGTPAAPTAAADTNTTQLATTAFVLGQAGSAAPAAAGTAAAGTSTRYARQDHVHPTDTSRAPLASPTFTGTPAAPTATADTNTTQLATTAFVVGQAASSAPAADGNAAVGTSLRYARQDHVHPTDTTRLPLTRLTQSVTTKTLAASDAGQLIVATSTVTTATNTLTPGQSVLIWNNTTGAISLQQGTSTTLYLGGNATAGNRSIATRGLCHLLCVATNVYVAYGTGVT